MATPNLIGVRNKLSRAKDHLQDLDVALANWLGAEEEGKPSVIYRDSGGKRWDLCAERVYPNDPKWALIVGDIVHNLRSALDHLAYQLAFLHNPSADFIKQTAFPICLDPTSFAKAREKLEPYISTRALTLIEELQPYKAANLAGTDPKNSKLWIVSELDIIDKHRILIITAKFFRITELTYFVNNGAPIAAPFNDAWQPLIDGAPLASLDFSRLELREGKDKMNMGARMEVQVFFSETGTIFDGLQPGAALVLCVRHISDVIELFERQFFNRIP